MQPEGSNESAFGFYDELNDYSSHLHHISDPLQCPFVYSYVILVACFLQGFLPKSCMHFSYIAATYPALLIVLDLIILVIFGEKYKL
jgi:hypothetical protein